ncbi:MAG: VOC family protein [Candidatus Poseidoniales archaeon]|jgi:methylmalonyl-CoA/ethylmalonyl-CoA epimerase|tara:strand:- start:774 stop:1175 length:402 start_codon:yes stop_codon:yes gene_type:complete
MNNINIDHIGIATESIEISKTFWNLIGFKDSTNHIVEHQGVKVQYLTGENGAKLELLEPLFSESPVGKFITKNGPGIQQLAVTVSDIAGLINKLKEHDVIIINEVPTKGADGRLISFIHPKSTGGVLVELIQE